MIMSHPISATCPMLTGFTELLFTHGERRHLVLSFIFLLSRTHLNNAFLQDTNLTTVCVVTSVMSDSLQSYEL